MSEFHKMFKTAEDGCPEYVHQVQAILSDLQARPGIGGIMVPLAQLLHGIIDKTKRFETFHIERTGEPPTARALAAALVLTIARDAIRSHDEEEKKGHVCLPSLLRKSGLEEFTLDPKHGGKQ